MKHRVIFSLLLALVVIGGATWVRVTHRSEQAPALAVVDYGSDLEVYNIADFLTATEGSATSTANLTATEGVILDYLALAQNGQITEENVKRLVDYHVSNFLKNNQLNQVLEKDIETVADSPENFQMYYNTIVKIGADIDTQDKVKIEQAYKEASSLTSIGNGTTEVMTALANTYEKTAHKLQDMSVPQALVSSHTKLVNNLLSTAYGMRAVSIADNDPTLAFAGLATANQNTQEEAVIVDEINQILKANGVF